MIKRRFSEIVPPAILPHAQAAGLPRGERLPPKLLALRITLLCVHRGILGSSNPRGYHDNQEGCSPNGHVVVAASAPTSFLRVRVISLVMVVYELPSILRIRVVSNVRVVSVDARLDRPGYRRAVE
jgi:hypothetical protein